MQNTKFVYIFYTKIAQIKILYDNECTKNVHTVQNLYNVQTKNNWNLKCMFFVLTNNVQTMQNVCKC